MSYFPDEPCALYRLRDHAGVLLYVGRAMRIHERMAEHAKSSTWWCHVARSDALQWYPTVRAAATAERRAYLEEQPIFNRAGLPAHEQERRRAWYAARTLEHA